jgi:hypothetical protein
METARQVNLLPATHRSLDATMENPGTWLFHCHVNHHIHGGMTALYTVQVRHGCHSGGVLAIAQLLSALPIPTAPHYYH